MMPLVRIFPNDSRVRARPVSPEARPGRDGCNVWDDVFTVLVLAGLRSAVSPTLSCPLVAGAGNESRRYAPALRVTRCPHLLESLYGRKGTFSHLSGPSSSSINGQWAGSARGHF